MDIETKMKTINLTQYLVEFWGVKINEITKKEKVEELGFLKILYPSGSEIPIESFAFMRAPPSYLSATQIIIYKQK